MAYFEQAQQKLMDGFKTVKGAHQIAMMHPVKDCIIDFCRQDDEFAQAVVQGGTLAECMDNVVKGIKNNCISDLDAYRRAVQFFFPGADITFHMTIDLCASVKTAEPKVLDLADFF